MLAFLKAVIMFVFKFYIGLIALIICGAGFLATSLIITIYLIKIQNDLKDDK